MSVSYEAAGAVAVGSTSLSIALPSGGFTAGKLAVVRVSTKPGATAVVGAPTGWGDGWTRVGEMAGTSGTNGADTGPTRVVVFAKIATGSESGSATVAITSGNSSTGQAMRFSTSTGVASFVSYIGEDTSSGTGYSASCGAYAGAVIPGDMLVAFSAGPSDTVTWASEGFAATGLTIGSATEIGEAVTSTGNDIGGASWYATVSSGTMSGTTVTASATLSSGTNAYGPVVVMRIRDAYPDPTTSPVIVGAIGATRITTGTLSITPPAGAATRIAVAFGDFTTTANAPTASGWKLVGFTTDIAGASTNRAMYIATTGSPGSTWTETTGLASIVVIGYDREVALDISLTEDSLIAPTLFARGACTVTRVASGVTAGVPGPTYPSGHSLAQYITQADLGGPYIFTTVASATDSDGGSVGSATWAFGTTVLDSASSVPDPMSMTVVAYTSLPPFTAVSAGSGVVWQDEFTAGTLDAAKWVPAYTPPGKFNRLEEQAYTPRTDNLELTGSELRIHGLRESFSADGITSSWTSGRITSVPMFRYGEIRARVWVPAGVGLWPAFWTLGDERVGIGGWPAIGENDIMETYGPATSLIQALHGIGTDGVTPWVEDDTYGSLTLSAGFYEFWATWTTTGITFGVDGTTLDSYTKAAATSAGRAWPFDNPQHIIVNLATGGSGWGGQTDGTTPSDNVMRVDWVRVSDAEVYGATSTTPPEGTGALAYAFAVTGTGETVRSGAGSLSYGFGLAGAGETQPVGGGALTYAYGIGGSGVTDRSGAGTLSYAFGLSGAGESAPAGAGSLAYAFTLVGAGESAPEGSGAPGYLFELAGTGTRDSSGAGAVGYDFTVSGAAGSIPTGTGALGFLFALSGAGEKSSSGTGALAFGVAVDGDATTTREGVGALAFGFSLSGAGSSAGGGAGSLTYGFAITGAGFTAREAAGALAYAFALSGAGEAPTVDDATGTGAVAFLFTLTGAGRAAREGVGSFGYSFTIAGASLVLAPFPDVGTLVLTGPSRSLTLAGPSRTLGLTGHVRTLEWS